MPTKEQGRKFREHLIDSGISLSSAVDFINDNIKPEDVFDVTQLKKWAEENGYVIPKVKID